MCHVLYIGASEPLPEIPWNPQEPAFHASALNAAREIVKCNFSLPHVLYIGSHMNCGCGFYYPERDSDGNLDEYELAEWNEVRNTRERLVRYVLDAVAKFGAVELYACWAGEEARPLKRSVKVSIEELLGAEPFPLDDQDRTLVCRTAP